MRKGRVVKRLCNGSLKDNTYSMLKKPVPKSLRNEFLKTGRYGHFSYLNIIHGGKYAPNLRNQCLCYYLLFYKW